MLPRAPCRVVGGAHHVQRLPVDTTLGVDYSFTDFGILDNVHEVALIIAF